ncbi:hypothetical protein DL93DRAFT_1222080 [Clavulina sp. PMI_390]|nr:hypothetical protein DL93DRAFT_1222080 [Clavulina sp. PMI_390]
MYTTSLITGAISRTALSYASTLLALSLFPSIIVALGLHLLLATRLSITAAALKSVYTSFSNPESTGRNLSPTVTSLSLLVTTMECIVWALCCSAAFRVTKNGASGPFGRSRLIRSTIPAYIINMIWQMTFAVGLLRKSYFLIACFGVPLGPVSTAALLALLHSHPSAITFSRWKQFGEATNYPPANARISVSQGFTTASCHDSPLEIRFRERLERQFPQEEETHSYPVDPEVQMKGEKNVESPNQPQS